MQRFQYSMYIPDVYLPDFCTLREVPPQTDELYAVSLEVDNLIWKGNVTSELMITSEQKKEFEIGY